MNLAAGGLADQQAGIITETALPTSLGAAK